MNKKLRMLAILLTVILLVAACAPAATEVPTEEPAGEPAAGACDLATDPSMFKMVFLPKNLGNAVFDEAHAGALAAAAEQTTMDGRHSASLASAFRFASSAT